MSSTTEQIKERLSIVDVIGAYIKLEKAGQNYKARCPFHNEKTPSFFVSPARNSYYCFGCGVKGDIFSFVEQFEGVDFPGALKILADKAGVEIIRENPQARSEKEKLFSIMDMAAAYFEDQLAKNPDAQKYLTDRGLKQETIKAWRVGFAPDAWRDLMTFLEGKKITTQEMLKVGLIKQSEKKAGDHYDRFRSRIMFPLFDVSGRVVAFSGRIFGKEDDAKYLNSPETVLFDKSRLLYGLHAAKLPIRQRDYSILVEGQMDLLMSHQAGFTNAVATSGTAVTVWHLESLKRISPRLIIAYDADKAGIAASERAWQSALSQGMEIKISRLPQGSDPADLIKKGAKLFADAIKKAEHIIDTALHDVIDLNLDHRALGKKIREKVLPYIARLESRIEQSHYLSKISSLARIPEEALHSDLTKLLKNDPFKTETKVETERPEHDPVKRKLFAIIFSYEHEPFGTRVKEKIESIIGQEKYNALHDTYKEKKDELLFEAEASFGDSDRLAREVDELLLRFEEDALKLEFAESIKNLQKAERDKDTQQIVALLKKCQDISYKLRILSQEQITFRKK